MRSLVGLILGLVGAILNLILVGVFSVLFFIGIIVGDAVVPGSRLDDFIASFGTWNLLLAIWFLVFAVLGIVFSSMMNMPGKVRKGGVGCLVSGILTLNLFMIIGGIVGIVVGGVSIQGRGAVMAKVVPVKQSTSAPLSKPAKALEAADKDLVELQP